MKALLQEDIDQNNDDHISSNNDGIFRNESNLIAVTPGTRRRPVLVRAAKASQKILKDEDSPNEEE